jgi:hypothetical protein
MTSSKGFGAAYATLCAVAVMAGSPAWSDPFIDDLPHSGVIGPSLIVEHAGSADYTIYVRNPNRFDPILLDFALVTTFFAGGPDPTDVISNPTVVQFPAIIAAGGVGAFVYSVSTGESPPDGTDFGVTNFAFSTEYSLITGAPNTPTVYLGSTGGTLVIQGQTSGSVDPTTFTALLACLTAASPAGCPNPPADFLYPSSLNSGNPVYGAAASKRVALEDVPGAIPPGTVIILPGFPPFNPFAPVPEPSAWATMLLGVVGVGAGLRRRRAWAA